MQATRRLGLLGASVTQHPQFNDLLRWLNSERSVMCASVSSVRAATVTPGLALANRGSKSLTIAIESGSERMRVVQEAEQRGNRSSARHANRGTEARSRM